MNQKQVPIGENPSVRRLSDQGGKDSDQSEKLFLDESEGKQKKEGNFSSTMQDGTKVDTDITSKLPRGKPNQPSRSEPNPYSYFSLPSPNICASSC